MGALRTSRDKWVEAGLQALAAGGINAVRVEALAKALGVTKGGFYGYFADREALLTAMLDAWERESVDEVVERVRQEGGGWQEQLQLAGQLAYSNERLLDIDLSVRDWARRDPDVAARLRGVDNRRMQVVRDSLGLICSDAEEVEARSLLAVCAAIGSHFLAADHPGSNRAQVLLRASEILLDCSRSDGGTPETPNKNVG